MKLLSCISCIISTSNESCKLGPLFVLKLTHLPKILLFWLQTILSKFSSFRQRKLNVPDGYYYRKYLQVPEEFDFLPCITNDTI